MTEYICSFCGWEGERKRQKRGSKAVETLIWSTVFFAGPIYSIWRRTGKMQACPNCQLPKLVKRDSDEGQITQRKFDIEMGLVTAPKRQDPQSFGNDKPAETLAKKKPVDPDEW